MVAPSMKTRGTQDAVGGQKQRIEGNRVLKEGRCACACICEAAVGALNRTRMGCDVETCVHMTEDGRGHEYPPKFRCEDTRKQNAHSRRACVLPGR